MIKKIVIGLAIVVAGVLALAATRPSDYVITREIAIDAPAERIFPYLNNSKLAEQWGPWAEVDPQAHMAYSGPDAGVGSKASWDSPGQLGTGSATITETQPLQRVGIQLEYSKPMEMRQFSEYLLRSEGARTIVTWRVSGKNTYPGRVMCLFMNMDRVVGGMFEKGLSNLKKLIEAKRS